VFRRYAVDHRLDSVRLGSTIMRRVVVSEAQGSFSCSISPCGDGMGHTVAALCAGGSNYE